MVDLDTLVSISRRFGADPEWVLAGGGNTSYKEASRLHIKASGFALGTISSEGFCCMERAALDAIWDRSYPEGTEAREAAVLADLMAARSPGETKRPSVETLMHGLFPQAYVVHTHPAMVNGMTCARQGEEAFRRLFGEEAIWVPFVDPGYVLALEVKRAVEAFRMAHGCGPQLMFMQNHGLLVAAEDAAGIERLSSMVVSRIGAELRRRPRTEAVCVDIMSALALSAFLAILPAQPAHVRLRADAEIIMRAESARAFSPLVRPFSPDHIVYAGHEFLHVEDPAMVLAAWMDFEERNGTAPRIIVIKGIGALSFGPTAASAETAMHLFEDACKVAAYSESFGGPRHMSQDQVDFIRNWEVEKYRSSLSGT